MLVVKFYVKYGKIKGKYLNVQNIGKQPVVIPEGMEMLISMAPRLVLKVLLEN